MVTLAGVPIAERMRAALELLRTDPRIDRYDLLAAVVSAPAPPERAPLPRHPTTP